MRIILTVIALISFAACAATPQPVVEPAPAAEVAVESDQTEAAEISGTDLVGSEYDGDEVCATPDPDWDS